MSSISGLAHALLLDGEGGAQALSWDEANAWQANQGLLWLHFNFEDPEVRFWLENHSGLSVIAYEGLLSEETRPRIISRGEKLLMSLRGVNTNPGQDPEDMVSIRIWTDGKRIISTYRRRLLSTQDVLDCLTENIGPTSVSSFITMLNDRLVIRMSDIVEQLEDSMLEIEENVLSNAIDGMRQRLALLRKQAVTLRRYLAPQREALNRLAHERMPWMDENAALSIRDINDRLIRHIEDIDAVRERATVVQEELMSSISEAMNQRTYLLTIVAAIFLPLGFFTGLMGINVGGMPGIENTHAFWVVAGLSVTIMVVLAVIFRLKKWV